MAKNNSELKLNPQQKEAVKHDKGPLLIIAGAGTGKTLVITERIKHLVSKEIVKPQEVLALTFTDKAAQEMEERVDVAMPYGYTQMWISTFHSFCDRVLRQEALHIGLDPRYHLMTEAETIRFLRDKLFDFELHYFRPLGNPTKFVGALVQHFSRLKDEDISPSEYLKWVKKQKTKRKKQKEERQEAEKWEELARAFRKYEELKVKEGVMDFADLISNTVRLFRQRPNVLRQYRKQFKYVLVDEFQDTNIAQYELIKLLAPPGKKANLTVTGDDFQSIYKFRGAAVSNILYFMKDYKDAKSVVLTRNYRSTQTILDHAYRLIQENNPDTLEIKLGIDKDLKSTKNPSGGPEVEFIHADRVENEADLVVKKTLELLEKEKREFSDFAILVRANNHSEPFARSLARAGVPYQFLGPGQLFRQAEVKDIIAYLKVLYDLEDSVAFYRVLTMEHFDIPARDLVAITGYARRHNLTLFEAAEKVDEIFTAKETKKKVKDLVEMVERHLKLLPKETAGQIAYYFLQDSGLLQNMVDPKTAKDEKKAQNLSRFFDKLKTYEVEHEDASVFAVVDWIDLSMELGESPQAADFDWTKENAVNILTVHSAKGLEFPVVFVVNLVGQRFPTRQRREQIPIPEELIKEILPEGDYHLQEERRLFYVAMTRAMDRLYLTAADYYGEGKRERRASPFVLEALGEEAIKQDTQKGKQLSMLDFAPLPAETKEEEKPRGIAPITYLSFSQINTFQFCPLHYKLKYILRIPTPPTAAQSFGTALHSVLRDFNQALVRKEKVGKKNLLRLYQEHWIPEGYSSKAHKERMKKRGEQYLLFYLKSPLHSPRKPPLAVEQPFVFPLTDSLRIGGKIDRVDKSKDGIEIIDYKTTEFTTKKLPSPKELAGDLQLSIYAMAANRVKHPIFGKEPGEIALSFYFFDKEKKLSTTRTTEQLKAAAEKILKIKEEIEASDFSCSGSFWCQNCEYKLMCRQG